MSDWLTMKKIIAYILFICTVPVSAYNCDEYDKHIYINDTGYWVFFVDKKGVEFNPYTFFDEKAISRRIKNGICLYDTIDFPVSPRYVEKLAYYVDSLDIESRWLNAVHVYATPKQVDALKRVDFVKSVQPAAIRLLPANYGDYTEAQAWLRDADTLLLKAQVHHMAGHLFHEHGYFGSGMRIAVFDAGFRGVETHPAFQHLFREGRIVGTYDFHRNRENVYVSSTHGTMVLSVIAGMHDSTPMGLAMGSEFLLARTEIRREPLAEEKYWLAAVEWADKNGADIINSSLGYIYHRYFPEQMDGQTSLVARAAHIAANKGILIVNSSGNQGQDDLWRIIVTPADADSVLTVGALDHPSMLRAAYSSVGPTADGRRKPNVSALGTVMAASRNRLSKPEGTSFASPLVAGFAACLWQMFPSWSNMDLFKAIERSASLYPYYDYAHGYGIPQATHFFLENAGFRMPTFDIINQGDNIIIQLRESIQRADDNKASAFSQNRYLYYHKRNENGSIDRYYVLDIEDASSVSIAKEEFVAGQRLFVHFNGYTSSIRVH